MIWPLVTLADVATINPRIPKGKELPEDVSFLPMAAVSEQGELINPELRPLAEVRKGFTYFERGDVLLAKITPCFENGKAAFLDGLETEVGFGSTEFHVVRPNAETLDGKFLFYMLWNAKFRHEGELNMTGSAGQRRVPTSYLERYTFALPPLETQKHIARVLEQADQLRKQAQQMESELNQLAQSLFLEMFGDPVTNPKNWATATLGSLVEVTSGATPSKANKRFWQGAFPWVSPKDMKSAEISDAIDHINECVFAETNLKRIDEGTILIVVRGMILVHTVPIAITTAPVAINQDIKALRVVDENVVGPRYLLACLTAMHDKLLGVVSTAAHGTKRIETTDLSTLTVPIPPMAFQHEFCKAISILREQVEASVVARHHYENMFQALMQRAFKGDLTNPGTKAA